MKRANKPDKFHENNGIRLIRSEGDAYSRQVQDDWVASYMPFVVRTVCRVTGRYVDTRNSEELGVGMEAFYEAVRRYDPNRGSFEGFASTIIRHRIIDYWRAEGERNQMVSLDEMITPPEDPGDFEQDELIKEELQAYEELLSDYGIHFSRLPESSPKHKDTRDTLLHMAREVSERPEWMNWIREKKRLPRHQMKEVLGVSDRMMTLHRKYLLACILLMDSDLDLIRDMVFERKEGTEDAI